MKLTLQLEAVSRAITRGAGGPLADTVERQDHCLLERGRIERAGCVTLMMLREEQLSTHVRASVDRRKFFEQKTLLEELFPQPHRHREPKGGETARRETKIRLEQPLEFEKRLVVESDMVDIGETDLTLAEAVGD